MTQLLIALALLATIAAQSRTAPDITLRTADGGTVRLTDYKGRVVIVDFWASWCAPCKTAFPALDTLFREYHARGVEVLAVNLDERRRDADAFLARLPHAMPVLFDPAGTSAEAFAVQGMPSSFVIDPSGVIRFTHIGYSGDVGTTYRREIQQLLSEEKQP